jgi:chemotaxis protein CheX
MDWRCLEETMLDYINSFIKVCTSVFKEFVDCDIKADKVMFTSKDDFQQWEISGVITMSGSARGLAVISMKTVTAIKITNYLTGGEHSYLDEEVIDAVGEIINIIAGNIKKELEDEYQLRISLPRVIRKEAHLVVWPTERERLISIPFQIYENETICLSIGIN